MSGICIYICLTIRVCQEVETDVTVRCSFALWYFAIITTGSSLSINKMRGKLTDVLIDNAVVSLMSIMTRREREEFVLQ